MLFISENIKDLLNEYGLSPKKSLGQNFLLNKDIIKKIVQAGEVGNDDVVLEVGGGFGVLTEELAKKAGKVIVIEKDDKLAEYLKEKFKGNKNVEIVHGDVLKIGSDQLAEMVSRVDPSAPFSNLSAPSFAEYSYGVARRDDNYKIIANLPYQITSHFLKKFLTAENKPKSIVLMLQKEVVERILAKKGQMSLLALSVQYFGKPKKIMTVSKNNFYPKPKVDSAVIKIDVYDNKSRDAKSCVSDENIFKLAKAGFGQKRKQLKNNLKNLGFGEQQAVEALKKIGLKENIRAQELGVDDWERLAETLPS